MRGRTGAGAQRRSTLAVVLAGLILLGSPEWVQGQTIADSTGPLRPSAPASLRPVVPTVVRVGKWATLAGSVLFGVAAYNAHQDAEATYDELRERCRTVDFSCLLDERNTYLDPVSEGLYDASQQADRRAARYLIGSEVLFVATAAGFIWELTHRREEPENIPFVPRVTQSRHETRVTWSLVF
jgi:hypothetical protein